MLRMSMLIRGNWATSASTPCNFNRGKRTMHQRHLTAGFIELRTSFVRPTGVRKCVSYTETF